MPKPEIAIQLDSEKPIIADQNRIFLTNKKAFTVHRHCPKCNDSTAARKVIILSRPGQPGSAKRHNSDLTWIYMKSVLSFCPKEEFSTFTFTDERDSDKEVIDVIRNHVRFSKRIHRFCRIAEMTFITLDSECQLLIGDFVSRFCHAHCFAQFNIIHRKLPSFICDSGLCPSLYLQNQTNDLSSFALKNQIRCVLCALMQSDFLFQKTNVALASVIMIARS